MTVDTSSTAAAAGQGEDRLPLAKRNALLLGCCQAIVGSASPIAISTGGLAGTYLLGADKSLATAPVTGFNIGIACGALLAAAVMRQAGRRNGFTLGALVTACGGAVACLALFRSSFWLFALGLLFIGVGSAFVQQYRFAAADGAPSTFKAQAISWVLAGGIFSAVIGPQIVIHTIDALAPIEFAGTFAAIVPLALLGIAVLAFLRMPAHDGEPVAAAQREERPLLEIVKQGRFLVALVCGIGSYGLMTFMMTGAPIAMVGCGFSKELATLGIQWHVLAMFGPSFFTGKLIARFGREAVVATGFVILMACAVVSHLGIELWNFWLGLILLGLGWNFGYIGATAMVTACYRPAERAKVQGFHDVVLFSVVALASLASGKVLVAFGWNALNLMVFPVSIIALLLIGWQVRTLNRHAPA